jgi:hypothetical protein
MDGHFTLPAFRRSRFGAGIIEMFTSENNKDKTSVTMSRTLG